MASFYSSRASFLAFCRRMADSCEALPIFSTDSPRSWPASTCMATDARASPPSVNARANGEVATAVKAIPRAAIKPPQPASMCRGVRLSQSRIGPLLFACVARLTCRAGSSGCTHSGCAARHAVQISYPLSRCSRWLERSRLRWKRCRRRRIASPPDPVCGFLSALASAGSGFGSRRLGLHHPRQLGRVVPRTGRRRTGHSRGEPGLHDEPANDIREDHHTGQSGTVGQTVSEPERLTRNGTRQNAADSRCDRLDGQHAQGRNGALPASARRRL